MFLVACYLSFIFINKIYKNNKFFYKLFKWNEMLQFTSFDQLLDQPEVLYVTLYSCFLQIWRKRRNIYRIWNFRFLTFIISTTKISYKSKKPSIHFFGKVYSTRNFKNKVMLRISISVIEKSITKTNIRCSRTSKNRITERYFSKSETLPEDWNEQQQNIFLNC